MARTGFENVVRGRMHGVLAIFLVLFAALTAQLFILQILKHDEYAALAARQHQIAEYIGPERGAIFAKDREGRAIPLALNQTYKTLAISPLNIQDPERVVEVLSRTFNIDEKSIREKMAKEDDPYEVLGRKLDAKAAERVAALGISGVFFEEDRRRIYPHNTLAAHLVGFVSKTEEEEVGQYGLERFYNQVLAGRRGILDGIRDAAGFWLAIGRRIISPSRDGSDIYLTLDYNIQSRAESVLEDAHSKWGARASAVLVMEPATGKILALAARPVFSPNEFSEEKNYSVFLDPLVESRFELGSVLKPITMAGALEEGLVNPLTVYEDRGEVSFGGYTIRNFDLKAYGIQTMTQVLEKSLNTGAIYVSQLMGKDRHHRYLKKFGFNEVGGVDLPGELSGDISHLDARRDIDFATASFGQGIAITPIQMATAMAAVANGGNLMRPYVVEKVVDGAGNETVTEARVRRQVISKETSEKLTKMLVSAVRNGFENRAGVKGYFVAGKTGTAQIPRSDRPGYYDDRVIHTFAGYAPAFDPKFLIYLQFNEPKGNRFAANTLTPAFHDLAEYILNYYEIPPDEK